VFGRRAAQVKSPPPVASGVLVAVSGLPGTGKTTVARAVADCADADLLRTDAVRAELFDAPEYTEAETRAVYEALFERARERLADGRPVVLDATFRRAAHRERAAELAAASGVPFELVWVRCPEPVVRERIAAREGDASDADFAVYRRLRESFEPIDRDHVVVDNGGTLAATRRQIRRRLCPASG